MNAEPRSLGRTRATKKGAYYLNFMGVKNIYMQVSTSVNDLKTMTKLLHILNPLECIFVFSMKSCKFRKKINWL